MESSKQLAQLMVECADIKKSDRVIEIGPGKVLSGLIKRIDKNIITHPINNEGDITNININD